MDQLYRYSIIPAGAITDPKLEGRDLQVLALLGRHTNRKGWCYRSQVKMAEELRCGRSTVQRSLDRLYQAGWVERRLRTRTDVAADPAHPHTAHAYRVRLDLDASDEIIFSEDIHDGGCPPVGTSKTIADQSSEVPADGQGVPTQDGQGGAHVCTGTQGNDDSELCKSNSERETRAREQETPVEEFLRLWPTAATDSRVATEAKWDALSNDDRKQALAGVEPFLSELKKHKRTHVPSGSRYLSERKWLDVAAAAQSSAGYKNRVFVREGTPAWSAWLAHKRQQKPSWGLSHQCVIDGKRVTGWWFPSLFPPQTAATGPPSGGSESATELQARLEAGAEQAAQDLLEAEGK